MTELYELRKLHGQHPQYVEAWASDRDAITRERSLLCGTSCAKVRQVGAGNDRR